MRLRGDEGSNFIESFENFRFPEVRFIANEIVFNEKLFTSKGFEVH